MLLRELIVLVKAPIPGRVKTRLQVPLSAEQAARLYKAFVRDVVAGARRCRGSTVSIAYEPHPRYPDLSWLEDAPAWFPQAEGDLGARLAAAFDRGFRAGASKVAIIGSDCPHLEPALLDRAFARLDDARAVLGPASDGGYYLIGLRAPMPHLFAGIAWSGPDVLEGTLARLRARGESFRLLPERTDIDTFADLKTLSRRLCDGTVRAPRSREAIQGLAALP